nr:DNA polymerase alpha catalytic subunit [Ipomoea batatas]
MSDDPSAVAGRRRSRGSNATARASALERLRAIRNGERCSREAGALQVKMDDPIYDVVDDDEYKALVAKRGEEARGFIVDDNGLGYGDEGQEEDWQRISNMFTSSVFKKSRDDASKNLSCDSIVDDVIAEFAPDEADREKRRRGSSILSLNSASSIKVNTNPMPTKTEKPIIDSVNLIVNDEARKVQPIVESVRIDESMMNDVQNTDLGDPKTLPEKIENVSTSDDDSKEKRGVETCDFAVNGNGDNKNVLNEAEVKVDPMQEDKVFTLNAKIKAENDSALSANVEWQAVRSSGKCSGLNHANAEENSDLELESDGSFPFFILDAYEELYGANSGILYLFGKVKAGGRYHSCCVIVRNMQRCVYAIPSSTLFPKDAILKLESNVKESQISAAAFHSQLHEMASELKTELTKQLVERNVSSFSMAPVKRNYAFERSDIPHGENYVIKINYPFKDPPLPPDLKGENFCALLGTHSRYLVCANMPKIETFLSVSLCILASHACIQSLEKIDMQSMLEKFLALKFGLFICFQIRNECLALELFLVKREIKGPSWLSISKFASCPTPQRVSWCKFEVTVDSPKDIQVLKENIPEIPPVVVAAINVKTIINEKQNVNEIVSASVVCCHKAKIDAPTLTSELTRLGMLSHFTVVRKLEGSIFPMGFTKEATDKNTKAGTNIISFESRQVQPTDRIIFN